MTSVVLGRTAHINAVQRYTSSPSGTTTSVSASASVEASAADEKKRQWDLKLLYDGECPLCVKEVEMLRRRDAAFNGGNDGSVGGKLELVDIAAKTYDARANAGISFERAMGKIHAIERDDTVITGIDAFRRAYETVGLGWVYAVTKLPLINQAADAVYQVWADNRLSMTGRGTMEEVLEARKKQQEADEAEEAGNNKSIFVDDNDDDFETCDIITGRCSKENDA